MSEETPVLQVEGLVFGYTGRPVFADWSARIGTGATLLQGDESSGKTTLLRLLAGVLPAQAGRLVLRGASLADAPQAYETFLSKRDSCIKVVLTPDGNAQPR